MAGRKISRTNMARIQSIADHAHALGAKGPEPDRTPLGSAKADASLGDQMEAVANAVYRMNGMGGACYIEDVYADSVIIEVNDGNGSETYWRAAYTRSGDGAVTLAARETWQQVEEVWQPVVATLKAGDLPEPESVIVPFYATVKALGDRVMELRVAWGYDGHNEQFHPERTDFDLENFPTPPVAYYHGYKADGKPAPRPVYIGKTIKRDNRADGHYLTIKLNAKPEADRVWQAALTGAAAVSPGTAGHLRRKDPDGTLTYWPIVEISAWDGAPSRKQAHPQSVGFPVLKTLYQEGGIAVPSTLDPTPPEATGDVVSADADTVKQVLAAEVARALLSQRTSA